ncbi:hypothetical protein F4780DRAFT_780570 [Xylariomycetidae sp. FL0641]|nr:hypothetical protein F4780DRAFT_780570 [Xylariomycetidae sp. FL0641]
MSACRVAATRPLGGIAQSHYCLQQLSKASARLPRANRALSGKRQIQEPAITIHALQRRHGSSSSEQNAKQQRPPPPKPSFAMLMRALRQSISLRPLMSALRGQSLRSLYKQSPEELVIALFVLCCVGGVCVYTAFAYFNYFQSEQFTRFPPQIAKSLRRALYYSNYAPDAKLALKYYKLALEQCSEAGLDPFSDEVMGVKIQLAAWLEKIGSYHNSIEVLEALLRDTKRWVEVMDKSARDGLIDNSGRLAGAPRPPPNNGSGIESSEELPQPENLWAKRTRILGRSVGVSVKLGELYASQHVLQSDLAGERLVWAVETVLKELQRRRVEGLKEGEGEWMSPEQIGGALEALADHYESESQHYLAAPLYLQAISLSPPNSCHTVVLMNNLAISLAQQPVESPFEVGSLSPNSVSGGEANPAPTRAKLLASAQSWALKSLEIGQNVQGEDRTEECDEACAVALCNLGDFADMLGHQDEAKRRFKECLTISKKIGCEPGVTQAQEGLRRLSATTPK